MSKLLLSGYFGHQNEGDEAILAAMIKTFSAHELTVLSADPEGTRAQHGTPAVHRFRPMALFRALGKSDVLISGGGSLFQDATSSRSLYYYAGLILLARIMRRRVIVYSQGVGPVRGAFNRRLVGFVFRRAQAIGVRDPHSKKDLVAMGVPAERIAVTVDPVLTMEAKAPLDRKAMMERFPAMDPGKPLVGLNIRKKDFENPRVKEEITACLGRLVEQANVVLFPFNAHQDVLTLPGMGLIEPGVLDTPALFNHMASLDLMVGERLHSLIFATALGVPVVGLSYDPKIDAFLDALDQKPLSTIESVDGADLLSEVLGRLERIDEERRLCRDKRNRLLSAHRDYHQRLFETIGGDI